jgi:hypothetical protein
MTRPRIIKGHILRPPRTDAVTLSARQRQALIDLAWPGNVDRRRAEQLIDRVQTILSVCADSGTRPRLSASALREALGQMIHAERRLEQSIKDLPMEAWKCLVDALDRDTCELPDVSGTNRRPSIISPLPSIPIAVEELRRAADAARTRLAKFESRGKPDDPERRDAMRDLVRAFRDLAPRPPQDPDGHAHDFVRCALRMVGVDAPRRPEKFWRMLPKMRRVWRLTRGDRVCQCEIHEYAHGCEVRIYRQDGWGGSRHLHATRQEAEADAAEQRQALIVSGWNESSAP